MRLSEFVIIYLAAAAPFGVAHVFRRRGHGALRARSYAKATAAALAWPAWLVLRALRGARPGGEGQGRLETFDDALVERAKRETINALRRAEDAFCASGRPADEAARQEFFAAREYAERYAGLALACDGAHAEERPSEREMELCRIAGRGGDDLLVAGRCVHRRNVTRLLAHRERARAEFEAAVVRLYSTAAAADANDSNDKAGDSCDAGGRAGEANEGAGDALVASLLAALDGAAALFSALGDREAAERSARLLAAARGRRAVAERAHACQNARTDGDPAVKTKGAKSCTTQGAHTAFADPPRSATTLTRG